MVRVMLEDFIERSPWLIAVLGFEPRIEGIQPSALRVLLDLQIPRIREVLPQMSREAALAN